MKDFFSAVSSGLRFKSTVRSTFQLVLDLVDQVRVQVGLQEVVPVLEELAHFLRNLAIGDLGLVGRKGVVSG